MKSLCVITARGGSKRIPKKNIRLFSGKPMIAYAIEAVKESKIFDEIMVSTDDAEIASIGIQYGAVVPFMRSEKTSGDHATTYDVIEEVINVYKERGKIFDFICCVYPCVPFLKATTLKDAYSDWVKMGLDALQPVCKFPVPIEWAMKIENGMLTPCDREAQLIRSQDLIPKYYDVGMFYFCKIDTLLKEKTLTPIKTMGYVIDETECQDIDTEEDWKIAELKFQIICRGNWYEKI